MKTSKTIQWSIPGYWVTAMLFWETLVHAGMYDEFQKSFVYALGFSAAMGLGLAALVSCLPRKAVFPVNAVLTAVVTVLYGSQLVYCFIFGTPYSVSQMGMGADAVGNFWRETLSTAQDHFLWLLALLLPLAVLVLLNWKEWFVPTGWVGRGITAAGALVLAVLTFAGIRMGGTGMYSVYYFFTSPKATTTQTVERFGVPTTFLLEWKQPAQEEEEVLELVIPEPVILPTETEETQPQEEEAPEPPRYHTLDVDFDALSASTVNKRLIALNDYFSQLPAAQENAYTGMLADYNLILICAESFSPAAVDPEITPTLYKLTHEGFLFNNFYNSFPNTTIDGEYALTQGLYPDSTRGKDNSSMLASAKNYLPFTLGNLFAQRGVKSWGYHNNIRSYYSRNLSHPNMGYEMKFNHSGMEMTGDWPTSDLEMMEQSVDDYIGQEQFHAYYMTFSGHYQYKVPLNGIANKNYHLVKDLPDYNMAQKAYLACHIELDKALEYLMNRLDEAGKLDKTVIVMAGDHFPYGLYKKEYFGMIGKEEDFFETYKSNLVFWVGDMAEPVDVNEYCCNVDVLPTILNLWGFEYDSRMLPGTDVFSDGLHAAVLIDRSFLTDEVWFNSNTGETRFQVPQDSLPAGYTDSLNRLIAARFDASAGILRTDYYRFALGG